MNGDIPLELGELQIASYRGVQWFVTVSDTVGGRRTVQHDFVNSDLQIIQDFGLTPRSFKLNGFIAARRDNSGNDIKTYRQARDELLSALEKGGNGILIHPFYGRFDNISVITWSLNESTASVGSSPISIDFAISNTDGIPKPTTSVISSVSSANDDVTDAIIKDVEENWLAETLGVFGDAVDKVNDGIDTINDATDVLAASADEINAFNAQMAGLSANVTSLVVNPRALVDSFMAVFATINGLYTSADGTVQAFREMFTLGDDDIPILPTTSSRVRRQSNRDIFNTTIQSASLGFSYLNASQIEFETVADIEEMADILEAQFQKLASSESANSDVISALSELRIVVQSFFDGEKVTARQVVIIQTNPISIRALAFQYYGSSDLGISIGELNELLDSSLVQGDVKVLTE